MFKIRCSFQSTFDVSLITHENTFCRILVENLTVLFGYYACKRLEELEKSVLKCQGTFLIFRVFVPLPVPVLTFYKLCSR